MPASPASITAYCLICGRPEPADRLFDLGRPIVSCRTCGLVYDIPREAGSSPYTEEYYRGAVYADYLAERPVIHRNARRTLEEIERLVAGRDLLDVGCAAGFFLEAARNRGWKARGLEVSEYAAAKARELGLPVDVGSIVTPPAGMPTFDAVTMWDTIEHLDRPDLAMRQIGKLLRPGGLMVVSTGDYGCWLRRLTGRRWRLFGDPTHRFFFTEQVLRDLISGLGFRIERAHHRGKHVGLPMILHQSPIPGGAAVGRWIEARGWHPSLYVNLFDVMTIYARVPI